MVELETGCGRERPLGQPDPVVINTEQTPSPIGLMDIVTRKQAEEYVRGIRNEHWVGQSDRGYANLEARMAIADIAYHSRPDSDDFSEGGLRVRHAIHLVIGAREVLVRTHYGHSGRDQDLWADQIAEAQRQSRLAREQRTGKIVLFPVNPPKRS